MRDEIKSKFITDIRLENYTTFDEYRQNILECGKYYGLLAIFEISLRNSIDNHFKHKISNDWLYGEILHNDTKKRVEEAKNKIIRRRETVTHHKIVAELSFGFWTSLFRKSYSNLIRIQDINYIFPNMPKKHEKFIHRNILDKKLNHIRKFRNRVFHYEKIINKVEYKDIQSEIFELLGYFDSEIKIFAKNIMKGNA